MFRNIYINSNAHELYIHFWILPRMWVMFLGIDIVSPFQDDSKVERRILCIWHTMNEYHSKWNATLYYCRNISFDYYTL